MGYSNYHTYDNRTTFALNFKTHRYTMNSKISLKELLDIAITDLKDLTSVVNPDFRLEQAEFNEGKKEWEIVVSFLVENTNKRTHPLGIPTAEFQYNRIYKKLKVNADREILGLYIFDH